jgi:hypothetical protein
VRTNASPPAIRWLLASLILYARCAGIVFRESMPHLKNRLHQQSGYSTGMVTSNGPLILRGDVASGLDAVVRQKPIARRRRREVNLVHARHRASWTSA